MFTKTLSPGPKRILRSSKLSVRLSQKDFSFPETQTLTAHPEKLICLFPSPAQKETGRFMLRRGNLSGSGIIRDSSSRSQKRINGSIFSAVRHRRIRPYHRGESRHK